MTNEELLEKAIEWFTDIDKMCAKLTSGNVSHLGATIRGKAIRAAEFIEKHKESKCEAVKNENLPQTSIPRELCKKCYDWCSQEDVGLYDIPHCINSDYCCRDYLNHLREDCPKFIEL